MRFSRLCAKGRPAMRYAALRVFFAYEIRFLPCFGLFEKEGAKQCVKSKSWLSFFSLLS